MSLPNGDPDLVRRFMNRPPTSSQPAAQPTSQEARTPFAQRLPSTSAPRPSTSRPATSSSASQLPSGTAPEHVASAMSLFARLSPPTHRSSVAALDQENDIPYSRVRSRIIEPEEYEQTRKKLKDAQYELSSTKNELEHKIIIMEQAAREAEMLKKKLMSRVDSLESDRRFLYTQEKTLNTKYQALEDSSRDSKAELNEIIRTLREENMDVKERFTKLREESRATESELSLKVRTLSASLTHQQQALAETKDTSQSQSSLAAEKHRQLAEALDRIIELEDQNRQLRIHEQGLEDVARVEKELKNQVAYIKQLEGTNRQLTADCKHYKEMYRNVEVLKEEKTALEQKLKMLDDLRVKCGMLEVQKDILAQEKKQWTAFLERSDTTDFNSPYDLAKAVASLRSEKVALLEARGEFEATLKYRDRQIEELEQQVDTLQKAVLDQEEFCKKQASIARQHAKTKELALRQVDSLKQQLKSYDTEETQLMGGSYDNQKNFRIEQLENLVQEYHEKLEGVLNSTTHQFDDSMASSGSLQLLQSMQSDTSASISELNRGRQALFEAKQRLEQEIEVLRRENTSLDAKVLELEMATGTGAFNPVTSRILEIKDSPASRYQAVRQHMLDSLKEENTALLKAVADLQQQQQQYGAFLQTHDSGDREVAIRDEGLIPAASYNRLKGEHRQLLEDMAENTKRSKRLKESWTLKADEFLDAVRSLLGYKVNFLDNGRVELISVYSAEEDQSFVFTSGLHDEGTMQLVGTGSQKFMEDHKETFDHWVNQLGSIPAFLSRVTLNLVEKEARQDTEQQPVFHRRHIQDEDYTQNSDMMMDV